jgi:hypothetical protein
MIETKQLIAQASMIRAELAEWHDAPDVGIILCFALALHKLDGLTDDQFVELVEKTLRKALADVKKLSAGADER